MIEVNDFNISDNIYLNGVSLVKKMSLVENDEEDYPENIIIYYVLFHYTCLFEKICIYRKKYIDR